MMRARQTLSLQGKFVPMKRDSPLHVLAHKYYDPDEALKETYAWAMTPGNLPDDPGSYSFGPDDPGPDDLGILICTCSITISRSLHASKSLQRHCMCHMHTVAMRIARQLHDRRSKHVDCMPNHAHPNVNSCQSEIHMQRDVVHLHE